MTTNTTARRRGSLPEWEISELDGMHVTHLRCETSTWIPSGNKSAIERWKRQHICPTPS